MLNLYNNRSDFLHRKPGRACDVLQAYSCSDEIPRNRYRLVSLANLHAFFSTLCFAFCSSFLSTSFQPFRQSGGMASHFGFLDSRVNDVVEIAHVLK